MLMVKILAKEETTEPRNYFPGWFNEVRTTKCICFVINLDETSIPFVARVHTRTRTLIMIKLVIRSYRIK